MIEDYQMTVEIKIKEAYGITRFYPVNETAEMLTSLTPNRSTLTARNLRTIEDLGYTVTVIPDTPKAWQTPQPFKGYRT
tara:strand:- start:153 stop:389 length:237 start_codon:yes stop_codon:yes gene_type:complete